MKQAKYILFLILTSFCIGISHGQTAVVARGGANGIFVFLNSHTDNNSVSYKIERKAEGEGDFKEIAVISPPSDITSFKSRYRNAKEENPLFDEVNENTLEHIWNTAQRHPDSAKYYLTSLQLQLAAGMVYFDNTAIRNVQYVYRVSEISSGNTSGQKSSAKVSFPEKVSYRNVNYSGYSFSQGQLRIEWKARGTMNGAYFILMRSEKEKQSFSPAPAYVLRKLSRDSIFITTIDTTIDAGRYYEYKLIAADAFGNIGLTTPAHLIATYDIGHTVLPQNIFLKSVDSASMHGIQISWALREPAFVKSVRIYRSEAEAGRYKLYSEVRGNTTSFTDQFVEPTKLYYYHFSLVGLQGDESAPTVNFQGTYYAANAASIPVVSCKGFGNGIKLTFFAKDKDVIGYRVYRGIGLRGKMMQVSSFIPASDKPVYFLDSSRVLSGRETYGYAVTAENSSHILSAFSDTVYARPLKAITPPAPLNVTVVNTKGGNKIFWQNMRLSDETISGYNVFRSAMSANGEKQKFEKINQTIISAVANSFRDTASNDRQSYAYYVQAIDGFGNTSRNSTIVSLPYNRADTKLPAPQGLAGFTSQDGVHIDWMPLNDPSLSAFRLYRYKRGESPVLLATIKKEKSLEFVDRTAAPGNLYFYYLVGVSTSGIASESGNELNIRIDK